MHIYALPVVTLSESLFSAKSETFPILPTLYLSHFKRYLSHSMGLLHCPSEIVAEIPHNAAFIFTSTRRSSVSRIVC